jgi:hypothetical protein
MKTTVQLLLITLLSLYGLNACKSGNRDGGEFEKIDVKASQPMNVYTSLVDSSKSTDDTMQLASGFYEVGVNINLSKNFLYMYHPDGRIERHDFPNSGSPTYKLTFDIRTSLKADQFNIQTYAYFPINGRPMDERQQGTRLSECGTYILRYYMKTSQKIMTGKFVIQYTAK